MASMSIRNLGLKLLSILIATMLWLVVAGERIAERVMRVPIELQNLPTDLEITSNPPDTVEVRLRGSSGALTRMSPGDISAVIDLRTARTGRRLFHLTPNLVNTPYGLETVQISPATLTMDFETTGVRVLPVRPILEGSPPEGFEVERVQAEPATVEVAGPESALENLKEAITEPVVVTNRRGVVREEVTVGVGDSSVRVRAPQTTTVTVVIRAEKP
ncbi:MAG: YbbR-like domain-containing protein [Acidobacteria bacterium]|nr:YbbR-like domain-containing protein [Acidobacteriota bacterium]